MSSHSATSHGHHAPSDSGKDGATRRDFLVLTASAMSAVGAASALWPFVSSMNPSADVLALSSVEQDISSVQPGQSIKIKWRGLPVFIRRRTPEEITAAKNVDIADLPDPEADDVRVQKGREEWLVVLAACTHLGCIPEVSTPQSKQGAFGGWFCHCHGSEYDTSGRIRKGPAPKNLVVPAYSFLSDTKIKIG
jgi:ubiquinol-cytochrome c reductase iron-sulfur subunit